MPGAIITDFSSPKPNTYKLTYEVDEEQRHIVYSIENDGTYRFDFINGEGEVTHEVYRRDHSNDRPPPPPQ